MRTFAKFCCVSTIFAFSAGSALAAPPSGVKLLVGFHAGQGADSRAAVEAVGATVTRRFRHVDALARNEDPPVTVADARASIELASAIYYSARTGDAVELPLGPQHPYYEGWIE